MESTEILDSDDSLLLSRRRKLLPTWIKVFVWIFLLFGVMMPVSLIFGIMGLGFSLSLYGLDSLDPFSPVGLFITLLFTLKGLVAFGLWTEKDWAVRVALVDAVLGILLCVMVMLILPFLNAQDGLNLTFRLELFALVPYFSKMQKIKVDWDNRGNSLNPDTALGA